MSLLTPVSCLIALLIPRWSQAFGPPMLPSNDEMSQLERFN